MKILFYCEEYPPAKNGGIGSVTKIIAEKLVQLGHSVYIVGSYPHNYPYYGPSKQPEFEILNGVKVYSLFHFKYLLYLKGFYARGCRKILSITGIESLMAMRAIKKVEKFIQNLIVNEKIEIVELTDYFHLMSFLKKRHEFKRYSVPAIMRVHGSLSFIYYYRTGHIPERIRSNDKNHFKRTDKILAVSKFSEKFVIHFLDYKGKTDTIYNPIEDSAFMNEKGSVSSKTILFFGKIIQSKGVFSLIKAFNLVNKKYPDFYLHLIGDGEIKKAKKLIHRNAGENVKFFAFMSKENLVKEIDKSCFCILPSYFENFSMAALEVLSRKKTLIYTNRCSGTEVIENNANGLLIDPDNIEEIAEKICFLIENPEINDRLALEGFLKCKSAFSETSIIKNLETEYINILQSI